MGLLRGVAPRVSRRVAGSRAPGSTEGLAEGSAERGATKGAGMRTCEECGTAVGDTWEYCLRCGEALPPPVVTTSGGLAGVLGRLGMRRQPAARGAEASVDGADTDAASARAAVSRFWAATVPLWVAAAVGAALSVALILAVVVLPGGQGGLDEAREAEAAALLEADRLGGELEQAQALLAAARERADTAESDLAALNAEASQSEGTLAEAREEAATLRSEVEEATGELEARQAALDARGQHIELLQECVAGMEVVVQFARSGLMTQATQAEEAISATCEAARTFG